MESGAALPLPYEEVQNKIESAQSITILSHINPDADALGTALGIYHILSSNHKGKKIEVVNASKVLPRYLDFLPHYQKIKHKMDYEKGLVITCDSGSLDRLGFDVSGRELINIDHHQSNTNYGSINVVLPELAASSQVAYMLFKELYPLDQPAATCFYTALLSDTRYFTTSSVTAEVLDVAKAFVEAGVDPAFVSENFTQRKPLGAFRILQRALASLSLHQEARVASLFVTKEDIAASGATVPDMDGIVDYGKSLATVEIACFVMELEEGLRISLRSKSVDVSKVAKAFGGGGHKVAAGFMIPYREGYTIDRMIQSILKKIEEYRLLG
ncbi:bifunctional oligoribonuclease/PAP phosphatase NrnA [Sulfurovum sp. zt1-1]|uniref:Bifunctional oligoribonuclease/PAP phosphatase NrnA n=1 Tax=Sulfurovum zhangzhouensis TaxID=3019067 RepID=A0ABT7QWU0_9BACT|nr:bifunctional oligoribonuclease/PAP phosphatase NrnA [Sulfurovum zhangzhouensis]MDM5271298.1 bifunctional oligoribonuclease/PAP phosphatase NrnA [Sulfurovum zhangzhouensis]